MKTKLVILLSLILAVKAYAGSATWNLDPATNDWNTATNWTPATVPNSTTDIATFGASNTTSVLTSANVDLASLVFDAGAPSYSIAVARGLDLTFWGEGSAMTRGYHTPSLADSPSTGIRARATMSVMGLAAFPSTMRQSPGALHSTTQ